MQIDEFGIKGNTGLTGNKNGIIHVNANYSSNGMVFVVDCEDENDTFGMSWERMSLEQAKHDGRQIITCHYCEKPAVSLDHSYPYLQGATTCKEHHEQLRSGKLKMHDC